MLVSVCDWLVSFKSEPILFLYGSDQRCANVTATVRLKSSNNIFLIEDDQSLNELFGDVLPNVVKTLYICFQNTVVSLPESHVCKYEIDFNEVDVKIKQFSACSKESKIYCGEMLMSLPRLETKQHVLQIGYQTAKLDNKLFIFGDSHGRFNFANLSIKHLNLSQNSITMHRVGRDTEIPNFDQKYLSLNSVFVFCYGEVDCRCHIGRQVALGRAVETVVDTLVQQYIQTIIVRITEKKKVIVCSVVPPVKRGDYEDKFGPITHEFPFVGTDDERVKYTKLVNKQLQQACMTNGFIFFDFYDCFARPDGTLEFEKSDQICHIVQNTPILNQFMSLIENNILQ